MDDLPALAVAVPLGVAAALAVPGDALRRRWADAVALAGALATTALSLAVFTRVSGGGSVYWFGGWSPRPGTPLGVSFAVDAFGVGAATLAGGLTVAALVFSWHWFEEPAGPRFHVLMLVFLAGMVGFAQSGDLFNLFVFFELMSTAAYALTGYKVTRPAPVQGALNFAMVLVGRPPGRAAAVPEPPSATGVAYGLAGAAGAVALAALALFRKRLPEAPRRWAGHLGPAVVRLRLLHSGHAGDYLAWLTLGLAALAASFVATVR